MNKMRLILNTLLVLAVCLVCGSVAQAQATRTWVSGVGDDANPCSRTAPCKTFAGAISKTATGGEISVLDPGGFGTVTITKAITINGDGTLAGILSASTNGVIVNAGATSVVTLRNLSINGVRNCTTAGCAGLDGVRYLAGKQLIIENCSIYGFSQQAIEVALVAATGRLDVRNSTLADSSDGVNLTSGAASTSISLDNVRIEGTSNSGVNLSTGTCTVSNSVIANNTSFGVIAQGGSTINLERVVVVHNVTGINTNNAAATVNMSNVTVLNNTTGISITAGTVRSFLNNSIGQTQGTPNASFGQQ